MSTRTITLVAAAAVLALLAASLDVAESKG